MQINISVDILVYFWVSLCYMELKCYLTLNKMRKVNFNILDIYVYI